MNTVQPSVQVVDLPLMWILPDEYEKRPVLPAPSSLLADPQVPPLLAKVQEFEEWRLRKGGLGIQPVGLAPHFQGRLGFRGRKSDWLMCESSFDPLILHGELAIPPSPLAHLQEVLASGLNFPVTYLVHELPSGKLDECGVNDIPVELLRAPASERTVRVSERLAARAMQISQDYTRRSWDWQEAAGFGVAGGLMAGLAVAVLSFLSLDPMICGGLSLRPDPRPGDPIALYLIAAWRY